MTKSQSPRRRWDVPARRIMAESQFTALRTARNRIRLRSRLSLLLVSVAAFALSALAAAIGVLLIENSPLFGQ